jgi:hypothetical protein
MVTQRVPEFPFTDFDGFEQLVHFVGEPDLLAQSQPLNFRNKFVKAPVSEKRHNPTSSLIPTFPAIAKVLSF